VACGAIPILSRLHDPSRRHSEKYRILSLSGLPYSILPLTKLLRTDIGPPGRLKSSRHTRIPRQVLYIVSEGLIDHWPGSHCHRKSSLTSVVLPTAPASTARLQPSQARSHCQRRLNPPTRFTRAFRPEPNSLFQQLHFLLYNRSLLAHYYSATARFSHFLPIRPLRTPAPSSNSAATTDSATSTPPLFFAAVFFLSAISSPSPRLC
jgi:hypothetical protein